MDRSTTRFFKTTMSPLGRRRRASRERGPVFDSTHCIAHNCVTAGRLQHRSL